MSAEEMDELNEDIEYLKQIESMLKKYKSTVLITDCESGFLQVGVTKAYKVIRRVIGHLEQLEPVEPSNVPGYLPGGITLRNCGACGSHLLAGSRYCNQCGRGVLE